MNLQINTMFPELYNPFSWMYYIQMQRKKEKKRDSNNFINWGPQVRQFGSIIKDSAFN